MIDFSLHPIAFLEHFIELKALQKYTFYFSKYIDGPNGTTLARTQLEVQGSAITRDWIIEELQTLGKNYELSLLSKIKIGNKVRHIAMYDLVGSQSENIILGRLLESDKSQNPWIFKSGRSLHVYYAQLLHQREWQSFMGVLLLANAPFPNEPHLVDTRWVGHALKAGFASLRLSCNSKKHPLSPKLINNPNKFNNK